MRSPFAIFRKHQKLLTVLLTGLAMFAFVILGAVNDPTNMPPALIVVVVASVFGGIGWLLGIRKKKMSEYGTAGLVLGAVVGVAATMLGGPQVKVKADTGDLNIHEFQALQSQRAIANQFLMLAAMRAREKSDNQFFRQPAQFGFLQDPERDLVLGELLRREAHELGIVVTDGTVNDFISAISEQRLGAADLKEIRQQMRISESDLYNSLRAELQARLASQFLYGDTTLPPEAYWEFYEQMNVRESVGIAPIPTSAFLDKSANPSDSEVQQLFDAHRTNFPNFTADGRLDEGLPGFRQPRRVRLAYVEAAYEQVEKMVTPPTEEEIEAFFKEQTKTLPGVSSSTEDAGPALPGSEQPPPSGKIDGEDLPPGEVKPAEDAPAKETPAADAPSEGTPPEDTPAAEQPAEEKPAEEKPPAEKTDDNPDPPGESQSRRDVPGDGSAPLQFVTFLQEETGTEAPEKVDTPATPAEEKPADSPAAATEPQENPSAEATSPETASPPPPGPPAPPAAPAAEATPPAASEPPAAPVLDEARRSEIRDQLLRERTAKKMKEVIDEVQEYMRELEVRLTNLPDEADYLTPEQAIQELRTFAEKKGLTFVETPPLSVLDLANSEEYPIGSAVQELFADPFDPRPSSTVVEQVFTSQPTEKLRSQAVVDPETDSEFVYWKIDDQAEYEPQSLSDPGIREQVVQTWREMKAREKAKARAEELAKLANDSQKPLGEVLAGQTVTGQPDAAALSVLHPPKFSWLSKADPRLSPNPWNTPPPERTRLRNVPGQIGDSFMKTIFDDVKPGTVGVAHSIDEDYFYVVRVDERSYDNGEEMQVFREKFLKEPVFAFVSDYPKLAQGKLQSYHTDLSESLFKKYGVEILETDAPRAPLDESEPPPAAFY